MKAAVNRARDQNGFLLGGAPKFPEKIRMYRGVPRRKGRLTGGAKRL